MDVRPKGFLRCVWQATCVVALLTPVGVYGEGSIVFNGSTSKLEHTSANILNSSNTMTITAWVKAAGVGGGSGGIIVALDETGDELYLAHNAAANSYTFYIYRSDSVGCWNFTVTDGPWYCIQVAYDMSNDNYDPEVYLNGVLLNETEDSDPWGYAAGVSTGYCVGNNSGQTRGWNGQIAHVQVHNRILNMQELDSCRLVPGSVTNGLRLWLRMSTATDLVDHGSGSFFNGTATALTTGTPVTEHAIIPPGTAFFPAGVTPVTQYIIPRYVDASTYPAGQVRGWGPVSVIRGTADTYNLTSTKRGIVITEEFDQAIAQWQSDSATKKAVLQAAVRDVTIAGHDDTGNNYASGNGLIHNEPALHNPIVGAIESVSGLGTSPIAVTTVQPHTLSNGNQVQISGVNGNESANGEHTITVTGSDTFTLNGTTPSDDFEPSPNAFWESDSRWPDKYHGLLMRSSGLLVENVNFFYIAGTALEIRKGGAGGHIGPKLTFDAEKAQIWDCKVNRAYRGFLIADVDAVIGRLEGSDLRDYGIRFPAGNYGSTQIDGALYFKRVGVNGFGQAAVWFESGTGACWGGPIYTEDCVVGMFIGSSENKLSHVYSRNCPKGNLIIAGNNNVIAGGEVTVGDGTTEVNKQPGIWQYGQYTTIRDLTVNLPADGGGDDIGETGIRVEGGVGGNHLILENITIVGPAVNGKGVGIEAKTDLNNSTIIAHVKHLGGGIGVDMLDGSTDRIGNGNTIWITYDADETGMTPEKALQLDLDEMGTYWDPENDGDDDTNDVRINGVRYYRNVN